MEKLTPKEKAKLVGVVSEIAKALGMTPDHAEMNRRNEEGWHKFTGVLQNGNGERIYLTAGAYRQEGRWVIDGSYPRDQKGQLNKAYNDTLPQITVSMDRSPDKIAQDIARRFLPSYRTFLADIKSRNKSADDYRAGRLAVLKEIARFIAQPEPDSDEKALYPGERWGVYKIEPYSEGTVKFDVRATVEQAKAILTILRKEVKEDADDQV